MSSVAEFALQKAFTDELNAPSQRGELGYALAVENGCRTLRKLAEGRGDVHQEHFWHKSEIVARRNRGESAPSESLFSMLYGLTADYGLSISRPFVILLAAVVIFSVVYAWLGGQQLVGPNSI